MHMVSFRQGMPLGRWVSEFVLPYIFWQSNTTIVEVKESFTIQNDNFNKIEQVVSDKAWRSLKKLLICDNQKLKRNQSIQQHIQYALAIH